MYNQTLASVMLSLLHAYTLCDIGDDASGLAWDLVVSGLVNEVKVR